MLFSKLYNTTNHRDCPWNTSELGFIFDIQTPVLKFGVSVDLERIRARRQMASGNCAYINGVLIIVIVKVQDLPQPMHHPMHRTVMLLNIIIAQSINMLDFGL